MNFFFSLSLSVGFVCLLWLHQHWWTAISFNARLNNIFGHQNLGDSLLYNWIINHPYEWKCCPLDIVIINYDIHFCCCTKWNRFQGTVNSGQSQINNLTVDWKKNRWSLINLWSFAVRFRKHGIEWSRLAFLGPEERRKIGSIGFNMKVPIKTINQCLFDLMARGQWFSSH